ncbi:glycosyltransferase family 9 protein [Paraburkholderia unamae]|nr:glycosyltransferase family 9 protein [Paraburkholderia unamae]
MTDCRNFYNLKNSFEDNVRLFNHLCDERRPQDAANLALELMHASTAIFERVAAGYCLSRIGMFQEAEEVLDLAWSQLSLPEDGMMKVAGERAYVKLKLGKIDEGAALEKLIYSRKHFKHSRELDGQDRETFGRIFREKILEPDESVEAKRIFMLFHGGLGDAIEHVRHAENLVTEGAAVVCVDPPLPLVELLRNSRLPLTLMRSTAENFTWADSLALGNILSLRYYSSAAVRAGYLKPVQTKMRSFSISKPKRKRKIGIVWRSSNSSHATCRHEPFRSMELTDLLPLFTQHRTQFYSLQFGKLTTDERKLISQYKIYDTSSYIHSLSDLANVMRDLDLVISIDSAPAHLAGALNVPVWNVLCRVADWRWGGQRYPGTPLYPSMRLFRQSGLGEWAPVVAEMASHINDIEY